MNNKISLSLPCLILFSLSFIFDSHHVLLRAEETKNKLENSHYHSQMIAENQDVDVEYMTNLALIKGHLIVGKELLLLQEYEQAKPHFAHPVDEIYGDLEPLLQQRNVPDFEKSLTVVNELVKFTPQDSKVMTSYDIAMKDIDNAIASLSTDKLKNSEFILSVINNLLATTQEEYSSAIIDNKVVENIEYQDSRGFVLYSEILYQNIADKNQELISKIRPILLEIKSAFPEPMPPNVIVKTPEEMTNLVKDFRQYTQF